MPDLTPYAGILQNGKWISKTDFIYRIKISVDSNETNNRQLLRALYQMHFSRVYKNEKGKLVFQ